MSRNSVKTPPKTKAAKKAPAKAAAPAKGASRTVSVAALARVEGDRKSTRLNSSHLKLFRMQSSA